MRNDHQHSAWHMPPSGTGYAVCECGATLRVESFKPQGEWHSCPLCVARFGVPQDLITEEVYHHSCKPDRALERKEDE